MYETGTLMDTAEWAGLKLLSSEVQGAPHITQREGMTAPPRRTSNWCSFPRNRMHWCRGNLVPECPAQGLIRELRLPHEKRQDHRDTFEQLPTS